MIRVPSALNVGAASQTSPFASGSKVGSPPVDGNVATWAQPFAGSTSNVSIFMSGDQCAADATSASVRCVSWTRVRLAGSIVKSWLWSPAVARKEIRPFGPGYAASAGSAATAGNTRPAAIASTTAWRLQRLLSRYPLVPSAPRIWLELRMGHPSPSPHAHRRRCDATRSDIVLNPPFPRPASLAKPLRARPPREPHHYPPADPRRSIQQRDRPQRITSDVTG